MDMKKRKPKPYTKGIVHFIQDSYKNLEGDLTDEDVRRSLSFKFNGAYDLLREFYDKTEQQAQKELEESRKKTMELQSKHKRVH